MSAHPSTNQPTWLGLAALPLVALALWIAIGERGPTALPLPDSVELPTAVAATIACVALSAALALCAWRRRIGLLVLGFVLVGIGMFWIALQGPPISGSLVWSSGSHGIHANDWWGLIPIVAGVVAWVWAWRSRHRGSAHTGPSAGGQGGYGER